MAQVVKVEKKPTKSNPHIRCSREVYDEIVDIANDCDLAISHVVTSLLEYALKNSKVQRQQKVVEICNLLIGANENDNEDK